MSLVNTNFFECKLLIVKQKCKSYKKIYSINFFLILNDIDLVFKHFENLYTNIFKNKIPLFFINYFFIKLRVRVFKCLIL